MSAGLLSRSPAVRSRHQQAWALSLSVHALALAGALTLFASVHMAPQPEPFRWTVSLSEGTVTRPQSPDRPPPAEPVTASPPSTPASADPVTRPPVEQRPVAHSQASRVIQKVAPVAQPIVTRPTLQDSTEPQVTHSAIQTTSTPIEQRPVQRTAQAVPQQVPAPSPVVEPSVVTKAAAVSQPAPTTSPQATTSPVSQPLVATRPVEPVPPRVVEQPSLSRSPVAEPPHAISAPVAQEVASVPQAVVPEPAQSPQSVEAAPVPAGEPTQASPEALPARPPSTSIERSSPKPDYGWLADALWKRIEKLKQYPQQARLNRLEGRVVLRVVIANDGTLQDLTVARSSGHAVLDEDALEVLRRAAPLTLVRPLGKSHVVVQVPISYRLDQ